MFQKAIRVLLTAVFIACLAPAAAVAEPLMIYSNNFDVAPAVAPGVSANLSGIWPAQTGQGGITTEEVQGYSGLGPSGNQLGGNFLRNTSTGSTGSWPTSNPAKYTTLTLTGLPAHTSVNVNFLLAIIDSWDGYGLGWGPDAFNVVVDGVSVFSQVFNNAGGSMTYSPPSQVLLSSGTNLGFSYRGDNAFVDAAYNMYLEPAFQNIAHSDSSLTISWFASGGSWQGLDDESWAIDNVRVVLNNTVPLPPTVWFFGSGLLGLAGWRRFRKG